MSFAEGRFHWTSHVQRTQGRVKEEGREDFKSMCLQLTGEGAILACSEERSTTMRV